MQIPGHLAIALAQSKIPSLSREPRALTTLLIASLFPDVIDKFVGYVLKLMPNGRHFAHNIFGLLITSLVVGLMFGRKTGFAWGFGYLGHLLADNSGRVPWLFPAKTYTFQPGRLSFDLVQMLKETVFLLLMLIVVQLSHSHR